MAILSLSLWFIPFSRGARGGSVPCTAAHGSSSPPSAA